MPFCVFGCKSGGLPRLSVVPPKTVVSAVGKLVLVSVEEEKTSQKMHQGFCWLIERAIESIENPTGELKHMLTN